MGPIATSFLASLGAGLATGIGALPALFFSKASDRLLDAMLGFAGGVMIAASMFGLLVPAFRLGGIPVVVLGSIIGVLFLDRANLLIPHLHRLRGAGGPSASLRRAWLVLLAMVIHNIPEGLAVGVSFGQDESASGPMLAFGSGQSSGYFAGHRRRSASAHRISVFRRRDALRGFSRKHPRKPSPRIPARSHVQHSVGNHLHGVAGLFRISVKTGFACFRKWLRGSAKGG
jgi:hypothetical protein